jgi:hypothetical protein
MPEHRIEVTSDDRRIMYSCVSLPADVTEAERRAAELASTTTVKQMLGRFGLATDLVVTNRPNFPTREEKIVDIMNAHAYEEVRGPLPDTDDILASLRDEGLSL